MIVANTNHAADRLGAYAGYGVEETMQDIFTGGPDEAVECSRQLQALGDGPEGDRLRCLVVRMIQWNRLQPHCYRGSFAWPDGTPMTDGEIGQVLCWPLDSIERDLQTIKASGLLENMQMPNIVDEEASAS